MKPSVPLCKILPFTLIELLITIAVIAILAGMLLPALNSARSKARGISCLGNQRQLGYLFLQYANTFDDLLPLWKVAATRAADGAQSNQWAQYFMENEVRISGGGKPYIYFCPENVVKYKNSDFTYGVRAGGWGDTFERQVGSGHWTWLKTASGSWDWSSGILNLKRLHKPSGCFYLADSVRFKSTDPAGKPPGSGGYLLNTMTTFTGIWEAHNGAVNMLYADGHVKNNLRTSLKAEWAETDNSKLDRTAILRCKDWQVPDPF